jgi:multidrug efflux pump subunit AcrA (membrane-fusion protein)
VLTQNQFARSTAQQDAQLVIAKQQAQEQTAITKEQLQLTRESLATAKDNAAAARYSAQLAEKSAAFASIAFQTSQRAYMVLGHAELAARPETQKPLSVNMQYKNVGQTPALAVNAGWRFWVLSDGTKITPLPVDPPPELGDRSIGSNLEFFAHTLSGLTGEQVNSIAEGRAVLIAIGMVVYKDIFGTKHGLEWCGMWNSSSTELSLNFCQAGLLVNPRFY